jgi:diguanylate cyclase (GGDEF)-like protein
VLFCNLAHELYQLGDCEAALSYVQEGLARCEQLRNQRLKNVLHSNRILCLLELERHQEALVAARALMEHNCQGDGPGTQGVAFEAVALAAAHGGDAPLGDTALTRAAYTQPQDPLPEVQVDLAVAQALLLAQHRYAEQAVQRLEQELPITNISVSLRAQCLLHDTLAHLHGQLRHNAKALEHLQHWRTLHMARTRLASQARYQAASLHTELLRVQRQRDDIDARRAATERARTELLQANRQLQEKMQEVQTLKDELQQQALRDSLTGLYNRRHLNETLPTLFAIARREAQPLAVVVIDLDHFKQVNDVHGHLAGDEVLQAFARLLQTHLRKSDVACRYGGEEFCLLMPATTVQAAAGKLAELLAMWRAHSFHVESGRLDALSFSAGIADSTLDTVHSMHVLKCADDYTLHAKRLGRNRICGVGLGEDFLCAPTQANVVQLGAHRHSGK